MDLHKVGLRISFVFIVATILILSYLVWLLYKPIEVYYDIEQPYKVTNEYKQVQVGEPVFIKQVYCKEGNYRTTIIIILEDGFYETLRQIESVVPEGCYDNISRSAVIPSYTLPGEYRIRYRMIVHVNPFRDEVYEFVSEYFQVVNGVDPI